MLSHVTREYLAAPGHYCGGGAVSLTISGPSDRVTDHCPMVFFHNRTVRRPVGRSVARSDGPSLLVYQPPVSWLSRIQCHSKCRKIFLFFIGQFNNSICSAGWTRRCGISLFCFQLYAALILKYHSLLPGLKLLFLPCSALSDMGRV